MLRRTILLLAIVWFAVPSAFAVDWTPNDLGDRLWLDWWAADLTDGTVSDWTSRNGSVHATQGTAVNRPTKGNGEVYFANAQRLTFPLQDQAYLAHRAVAILFRIDLSGSGDGSIFSVNGVGGGNERQPYIGYDRSTNKVNVQWKTPNGYNVLEFSIPENANQWHCLVSRRVGNVHYASLDGKQTDGTTSGESQITMADGALPIVNTSPSGYLGDFRTSTPIMAIDTILLIQDELSLADAQKIMGWAMLRRNAQSQLPNDHPYRYSVPQSSPPAHVFVESTPAQWSALSTFWDDTDQSEAHKGESLDLTGWALNFEDHFTSHTISNEVTGEGAWYSPVHQAATGSAQTVIPTDASPQGSPATYIQSGSEMKIKMQQDGGVWKSGVFCSTNLNGLGQSWLYPYVEVRMKIGASSTGNTYGAWPALWLKSKNLFFNRSESYLEYDFYEGYISDNKGFHNTIHNWPAARTLPERLQSHRYKSNYLGLQTPGWYQNVNLFDGQYHTYGVMVTPTWVINMFDGKETFRFPTPIEMKQPLWFLVDLAMLPGEVSQASGVYELTLDYVRVYQNPAYGEEPPGEHVILAASDDAHIDSRNPNDNGNSSTYVYAGHADGTNDNNLYTLVKFDVSSGPAVATSATLKMYRYGGAGTGATISAYPITGSWLEGSVTWNTQPAVGSVAGQATVDSSTGVWHSIDITALYNAWKAGTTNNGVELRLSNNNGETFAYRPSEYYDSNYQPYLDVVTSGSEPPPSGGDPVTLIASNDAHFDSRNPTENSNSSQYLYMGHADGNNNSNLYTILDFDLSSAPEEASEARLELYRYGGAGTGATISVYPVTGSWIENSVTWNTQPSVGSVAGQTTVGSGTGEWHSIDITSLYNAWKAQTQTNYGVEVRLSANNGETYAYRPSEYVDENFKPRLVVTPVEQIVTATPSDDAHIDSRNPNDNGNSSQYLYMGHGDGSNNTNLYALLKFDMSSLPANATSVVLKVYRYGGAGTGATISAYPVNSNWTESGVTWNNQPTVGSVAGQATVGSGVGEWHSIDITSLYNAWKTGTQTNYGVELRLSDNNGETYGYRPSEYGDADYQPYLEIRH